MCDISFQDFLNVFNSNGLRLIYSGLELNLKFKSRTLSLLLRSSGDVGATGTFPPGIHSLD